MKNRLFVFFICFIASLSYSKDLAAITLTVTDRFDQKGLPHAKVELYTNGKKFQLLKTLYSDESGMVKFDSLTNGNYQYIISCPEYISKRGWASIEKGESFETSEVLDLTDDRKIELIKPYILTKEDAQNLKKFIPKGCKDSLENQPTVYSKGFQEFNRKLTQLMVYPQEAQELGIEGKIYVTFIVTEAGEITKVGTSSLTEDKSLVLEALLTVLLIDHFEPAICNGKPIASIYSVPITFSLN